MSELSRKLANLTEEDLSRIYMEVFNTDNGQLVLQDLKNRCFFDISTSPDNFPIDALTTIKNEGKRSVLLHILTQLKPIETAERKEE